jgi:hypothetical protein
VERTPEILKEFGMTKEDLPFLAAAPNGTKCYLCNKERTRDVQGSEFVKRFQSDNSSCGEVFEVRTRVKREIMATIAPVVVVTNGNDGFFTVVFAFIGLFVIGLLRLSSPDNRLRGNSETGFYGQICSIITIMCVNWLHNRVRTE